MDIQMIRADYLAGLKGGSGKTPALKAGDDTETSCGSFLTGKFSICREAEPLCHTELQKQIYLVGVKGAEREDPTLQGGDESGAALRHPLGEITGDHTLL